MQAYWKNNNITETKKTKQQQQKTKKKETKLSDQNKLIQTVIY